jgi:hypothetical protein
VAEVYLVLLIQAMTSLAVRVALVAQAAVAAVC